MESTDETEAQDTICLHEDPFTRSSNFHEDDNKNETQAQDTICLHEDPFTSSANFHEDDHEHGN